MTESEEMASDGESTDEEREIADGINTTTSSQDNQSAEDSMSEPSSEV